MENPIFKLEGVVKAKDEMEDFEGPLNLILQLLSKNKIAIKDVSISMILDQYLAYLDQMASMDLEIASEFVSMASHLVYIKTKKLLSPEDEEISEMEQLIMSLEELKRRDVYAQVKAVTESLSQMSRSGTGLLIKPPEYLPPQEGYQYSHDKSDLKAAILRIMDRETIAKLNAAVKTVPMPSHIPYSVTDKAEHIVTQLREWGVLRVQALFTECESRSEMVATFIALLELCKVGRVLFAGTEQELTISYSESGGELNLNEYEFEERENGNS